MIVDNNGKMFEDRRKGNKKVQNDRRVENQKVRKPNSTKK